MILDPMFTSKESCPHHQRNNIFGRNFGVPSQITNILCHDRRVTYSELLRMYSITISPYHLNITILSQQMEDILNNLLLFSLPGNMVLQVQNKFAQTNSILDAITYSKVTQCASVQCYFLNKQTNK